MGQAADILRRTWLHASLGALGLVSGWREEARDMGEYKGADFC